MLEEVSKTRESLFKMKRICRALRVVTWISLAALVVFGTLFIITLIVSFINGNAAANEEGIVNLVYSVLFGVVVAMLLVTLSKIFNDVVQGDSPFTMMQVKRLRTIAVLLVAYSIFDNMISNTQAFMQLNGIDSGVVSTSGNAIFTVSLTPLIIAAAVFAFSFVFKYGVLLQEFSDETI